MVKFILFLFVTSQFLFRFTVNTYRCTSLYQSTCVGNFQIKFGNKLTNVCVFFFLAKQRQFICTYHLQSTFPIRYQVDAIDIKCMIFGIYSSAVRFLVPSLSNSFFLFVSFAFSLFAVSSFPFAVKLFPSVKS